MYALVLLEITMTNFVLQVKRNESNFVWASHGLVVELAENAYWFWNAPKDAHGTTMNSIALGHPDKYGAFFKQDKGEEAAQWTRALVMPHVVRNALLRDGKEDESEA